MPAANQAWVPAAFRMRSTGESQGFGGAGNRTSSMVKPPLASRVTPVWVEPEAVALAAGPQKSVAKTFSPALVPSFTANS